MTHAEQEIQIPTHQLYPTRVTYLLTIAQREGIPGPEEAQGKAHRYYNSWASLSIQCPRQMISSDECLGRTCVYVLIINKEYLCRDRSTIMLRIDKGNFGKRDYQVTLRVRYLGTAFYFVSPKRVYIFFCFSGI